MTLQGIIAYPITPFTNDGHIDQHRIHQSTEHLLSTGPAAIAFLGSTGESAYLSDDEWRQVARIGIDAVAGRVPVIVGISELTTDAEIKKARFAGDAGADMLMVMPCSYWKLTEPEVFDFYADVAAATDLPIMAYNNPVTSGVDMSPDLLVRLVRELKTVQSIKESSGDLNRMHAIRLLSDGAIPFYNGTNYIALEAFAAGASGWCTAAPNILDKLPLQLFEHVKSGRIDQARDLFYRLLPILKFIVAAGLPTSIKAGLALRGLDVGAPRRPLKMLDKNGQTLLQRSFAKLAVGAIV